MMELEDHSFALDNFASTYVDVSKLSDTLPSISIDDNNLDHDFFLKEHYDKVDRLRKENFDLKLKLYLLESNEKFTNDSELKFKVLNEFEKKNEEIRHLKEKLISKNKENDDLKKLFQENDKKPMHANKQFKSKLTEALEICSNLVRHAEQLIHMNRKLAIGNAQIDELNSSQAYLEKASRFLSENSVPLLDVSGNVDTHLNGKISDNKITMDNSSKESTQNGKFTQSNRISESNDGENSTTKTNNNLNQDMIDSNMKSKQENIIAEFMKVIENLRNLIDDFRSNKLTYKLFSTGLDSLFEELSKQYKLLENLQLNKGENDARLKSVELILKNESAFKEKIKSDLSKKLKKLDLIISKAKQSL